MTYLTYLRDQYLLWIFLSQWIWEYVNTRPSAEELDLVLAVYIFKYTYMHMIAHIYIEMWDEANAYMYICKFPYIFVFCTALPFYHFILTDIVRALDNPIHCLMPLLPWIYRCKPINSVIELIGLTAQPRGQWTMVILWRMSLVYCLLV